MRFSAYSRRVRRHGFHPVTQDFIAGEMLPPDEEYTLASPHHIPYAIWDFLLAFGPRPLLPNLQSIYHNEWALRGDLDWRKTPYHSAELLFGPKLQRVEIVRIIDPHGDPQHTTALIRSLSNVATSLEELIIEVEPNNHDFFPEARLLYGADIRLFQSLTSFSSRSVCIAPDALLALGQLPYLESLLLHVDPTKYAWDALLHGRCADLYPALLRLDLHDISTIWCTSFLRMVSSTSLRMLSIRCVDYPPPPPRLCEALCAAISNLPAASLITDLAITFLDSGREPSGHNTYWSEDISPLFTLTAIQRLVIGGGCTTILDDLALEVISKTWPDLVELILGYNTCRRTDDERTLEADDFPYATPWGLAQLARHCPRLTQLALAVDLRFYPTSHTEPDSQLAQVPPAHLSGPDVPALLDFDATGSLLGDPVCIASFLSLLFPQLREIRNDSVSEAWWDVTDSFSFFARVRAQERVWGLRKGMQLREPSSET